MVDYVKREDVHLAFDSYYFPGVLSLRETIDSVPSADVVKRKKGKWIDSKCSECGGLMPITKVMLRGKVMWETDYPMSRFCPNCGAQMESEREDE